MRKLLAAAVLAAPLGFAQPAAAARGGQVPGGPVPGDPVKVGDALAIDPLVDARLRWEHVDQAVPAAPDADALTVRLRAGAELRHDSGLALLAEAEATLALIDDYNAFPFAAASGQRRPRFATVADPMTIELNRLQLQYKGRSGTLTFGRQRINLDDQRWVGAVGWRQNEQTFDAVRGETKAGPLAFDAIYAIGQRTVFGIDAGPRQSYDGEFVLLGAGSKLGPVQIKAFAYLIDYDEAIVASGSSQTYGIRATTSVPLAPGATLNLAASYARQTDYGSAPADFAADYLAGEGVLALGAFALTAGWEKLGSDPGAAGGAGRAVQTPLATLHKFNGWADVFLTTPNRGLQDLYLGVGWKPARAPVLPGLAATLTWHRFDSDAGNIDYGEEWDASLGFRLGRVGVLAKYANYQADRFGVDTEKLWLQAEVAF